MIRVLLLLTLSFAPVRLPAPEPLATGPCPYRELSFANKKLVQARLGIRQLTGMDLKVGQTNHPDKGPADPVVYETADGRIQLYGTQSRNGYLEYPSWEAFLKGEGGTQKYLDLYHPDGTKIAGEEAAWDLLPHRWPNGRGGFEEVLYAGAMTPTGGRKEARWPEDNWNRRIYAFREDRQGRWVRDKEPLFSPPPEQESWADHSYGHHFITDENGDTWVFYEKVSQAVDPQGKPAPYKTEIFARKMISPTQASAEERPILRVGDNPYPSMRRTIGGFLVEGPRPSKVSVGGKDFYFVGFSSGDFSTDRYFVNVAWSTKIDGEYKPVLNKQGSDLLDLGERAKEALDLSWGPARPHFFQDPKGKWWVVFHAVEKGILPDNDYTRWPGRNLADFHRNIYLAPVEITLGADGNPRFNIQPR
jgi:hypothetical protein